MKIIVIDDEIAALNTFLLGIVDRSEIECNMFLHDPLLSIQYIKDNKVDVAFLDINMPIINGVDLAEKLIEADGRIKIIFISGYTQDIKKINQRLGENLIGFCNKPYDIDELNNLLMKAIAESNKDKTILIKTFGTFDVFIDKNAVKFSCAKSKELLAILVNARGGYVNMDCAIAALWPDKYVLNSKRLYRDAVYKLRKDLGEYGLNLMTSSNGLSQSYPAYTGFVPKLTVYQDDKLSFVYDKASTVAIYYHDANAFVYTFNYNLDNVYKMADGNYLAIDKNKRYFTIIDVSLINEDLIEVPVIPTFNDVITENNDGSLELNMNYSYSHSFADDNYIYLFDLSRYSLDIYDIDTLVKVRSISYMLKPECIDVYNGKIAIGFGEGCQIWYYEDPLGEKEIIQTSEEVYSIAIYNDKLIHSPIDQHCRIYYYDLITETNSAMPINMLFYYVSFDLNREDNLLYLCDRQSSSCDLVYFDLINNQITFCSNFGAYPSNNMPVVFDGNYVHYYGKVFDKNNATIISNSNCARAYSVNGYSNIKTIYDDGSLSVFTANKNNTAYTVFYDVDSDDIIKTMVLNCNEIIKTESYYLVFSKNKDTINQIPLSLID